MLADRALISPLGDRALVVAFSDSLTLEANARAIEAARNIAGARLPGVIEVVPNLVSVHVGYDPAVIGFWRLSGEIQLALHGEAAVPAGGARHTLETQYGRADGPDLDALSLLLDMTADAFIAQHAATDLRVLAMGFAPGFLYCGLHGSELAVPRRDRLQKVPAGTVLFAAGQTAVCGTPITTGWWAIGRTAYRFDPAASPPVSVVPGDTVRFEAAP